MKLLAALFIYCKLTLFNYLDWASHDEDADDVTVWEDNWDDDNVKDDFSQQLRLL